MVECAVRIRIFFTGARQSIRQYPIGGQLGPILGREFNLHHFLK
jgi:hypothetical protein